MPRYFSDHLDAGSPGNPPKRENYTDIAEYATAMRKYRMLNPTIVRPVAADIPQTTKLPGNRVRIGGKDMSEEEYLGEGGYRDKAIAEQKRLGREGRGYDLRGGGGQQEDGNFRPTPNVPTITPTYKAPTPTPVRDNMANASELDRYREFVEANKEIAKDVKRGQAGYEEIQAILAEKEGGPGAGALLDTMYQYDRSAEDARSLMSGTAEKPMSMEWNTDMGINARSTTAPIPAEGIPQTGTSLTSSVLKGGSISPEISRNLMGPGSNISKDDFVSPFGGSFAGIDGVKNFNAQIELPSEEIQTTNLAAAIPQNSPLADIYDANRAIAFSSPEELKGNYMNKIMGRG